MAELANSSYVASDLELLMANKVIIKRQLSDISGEIKLIKTTLQKSIFDSQAENKTAIINLTDRLDTMNQVLMAKSIPESSPTRQAEPPTKPNLLIVGTSLNKNLNKEVLAHVTDKNVKFATAFTVDADEDAFKPETNFWKVVPEELKKDQFETLILQSGPNEITNLDTKQNYADNISTWKKIAYKCSERLYELAQKALIKHSSLKKVIIVKRICRFDCKIKSHLSEYANSVFDHLWMKNGCPSNIVVEKQNLDCKGEIKSQCFGSPGSPGYDGIHPRGKFAVQHFTRTFIDMYTSVSPQSSQGQSQPNKHQEHTASQNQSSQVNPVKPSQYQEQPPSQNQETFFIAALVLMF